MTERSSIIHKKYVCGCIIEEDYEKYMTLPTTERIPFLYECKEHGDGWRMWYPDLTSGVMLPHIQEIEEEIRQLTGLS